MDKKEYLTEENYQKGKKKITRISLIILIVGVIIGVGLITSGLILSSNAKKVNEQRYNEAYKKSQENAAKAQDRIDEIEKEKNELKSKINEKQSECDSLKMSDDDWFNKMSKCERESQDLSVQLSSLDSEEFNLKNGDYTVFYDAISSYKYIPLYMIGGFIIIASCMISGVIYIFAKRREILAFSTQQVMPVAQEGIEKMAPTVGNAVGEVAKGITKGIKEGLNDDENK